MSQSNGSTSPLLQALLRHPLVRAVVRVDPDGEVLEHVGQAYSLKREVADSSVVMPIDTAEEDPEESLYICTFDEDYLVVIFDDESDFESLKKDIDSTVAQQLE